MKRVFKVKNIDCANCAAKIETSAQAVKGVEKLSLNFLTQKLSIEAQDELFEDILVQITKIARKIEPDFQMTQVGPL